MKNSYREAIIAGTALGLYGLVSIALYPQAFDVNSPLVIPYWDKRIGGYANGQTLTLGLEFQAVLLRFCSLLIEHGFLCFVTPILLCCAFVKLSELGRTVLFARLLVRSIKLTGLILGILCLVAMIPVSLMILAAQAWQIVLPNLFLLLPFLFMQAIKWYLVPVVWIISLLTEWWRLSGKWESIQE